MSTDKWEYSEDKKQIIYFGHDVYVKSQDVVFKGDDRLPTRSLEVLDLLVSNANIETILDLGTRDGMMLDEIAARGLFGLGVDISPRAIKHAKSKGRNVIEGDIHELSEFVNTKFDAILCIHCLEHCHTPSLVLGECHTVLNKGGFIAVRVPIQKDLTEQRNKEGLPPHYSVYTPESLMRLMSEHFLVVFRKIIKKDIVMIGRKDDN